MSKQSQSTCATIAVIVAACITATGAFCAGAWILVPYLFQTPPAPVYAPPTREVVRPTTAPVPTSIAQSPPTAAPTREPSSVREPSPTYTRVAQPTQIPPTPTSDKQNPPSGSVIVPGQAFSKSGIAVWTQKNLEIHRHPGGVQNDSIGIPFYIANNSGEQYVIRWKNSLLHLKDDKGHEYQQWGDGAVLERFKQINLPPGKTITISCYCDSCEDAYWSFAAVLTPDVKYLIFTIDQIAGMTNLNWRYDVK